MCTDRGPEPGSYIITYWSYLLTVLIIGRYCLKFFLYLIDEIGSVKINNNCNRRRLRCYLIF